MWKWDGSFSTSGGSWGWQLLQGSKDSHYMFFSQKSNTDIFRFFIISSHLVGVSLVEFCPVQPCLLQAKHPGLDSPLPWHLHLPMTKGISKEAEFFCPSSKKEMKANSETLHLGRTNNILCPSWSSVRFKAPFRIADVTAQSREALLHYIFQV